MTSPAPLCPGDTVALLAPSGPCRPETLDSAVNALTRLDLHVRVYESCRTRLEYLSAPDARRAGELNAAFADKHIKAVFAARGGYGSQRVLPLLDYAAIRREPKIFAGYSDATALHIALNQRCGLVTYHAPMAATELNAGDAFTLDAFTRFIFGNGEPKPRLIENPGHAPFLALAGGGAEGLLTGGNLSMLASSIGTPFEIDTRRRILFIEETREPPYRIDRMFLQLKYAGKLEDCAGVLLGRFSPEDTDTLKMIIDDYILPMKKPVLAGICCGHGVPTLTLPLGAYAVIRASCKKLLVY